MELRPAKSAIIVLRSPDATIRSKVLTALIEQYTHDGKSILDKLEKQNGHSYAHFIINEECERNLVITIGCDSVDAVDNSFNWGLDFIPDIWIATLPTNAPELLDEFLFNSDEFTKYYFVDESQANSMLSIEERTAGCLHRMRNILEKIQQG